MRFDRSRCSAFGLPFAPSAVSRIVLESHVFERRLLSYQKQERRSAKDTLQFSINEIHSTSCHSAGT
jgi:hypothetical protein